MATKGPELQSVQRQTRMLPLVAWTVLNSCAQDGFAILSLFEYVDVESVVFTGRSVNLDVREREREREGSALDEDSLGCIHR